ncbi:DnaJ domain [Musa troglodytarum]|uniref:DnaJ domain n=1 Tax=Musa troglodytarum TaxID=320322 RepID=A0A9E7J9D1_9LILI|nr:DnaJ domain [Musa troglodytarum]URD71958.1 DnaJ domain [Musa troglodytarum]
MSNLGAICRRYAVISSIYCRRSHGRLGFAPSAGYSDLRLPSLCFVSSPVVVDHALRMGPGSRANLRRTITRVSNWNSEKSPYETLAFDQRGYMAVAAWAEQQQC